MNRFTPGAMVALVIPPLIGATIGATIYRVSLGGWDLIGWLTAAFFAAIFFVGNMMIARTV